MRRRNGNKKSTLILVETLNVEGEGGDLIQSIRGPSPRITRNRFLRRKISSYRLEVDFDLLPIIRKGGRMKVRNARSPFLRI
jgi:hypothetical protein